MQFLQENPGVLKTPLVDPTKASAPLMTDEHRWEVLDEEEDEGQPIGVEPQDVQEMEVTAEDLFVTVPSTFPSLSQSRETREEDWKRKLK